MRIDEPLWPVVRETSRLILREEDLVIELPKRYAMDFEKLILEMSDFQPAKINYPVYEGTESNSIDVFQMKENMEVKQHLAHIGMIEPNASVRWIKMTAEEGWINLLESCRELHEAGYPGCVGCGGPNSELPWDEAKNRRRLSE
ncbi:MAG: hypothetical protein HN458_07325 [Euryarchaeota archaeon]|jgi:hypothetical protein|nr:hypothetical protein [Euryarchaeota archaeon]